MEFVEFWIRRDLCENLQKLEGHEFGEDGVGRGLVANNFDKYNY